MKKFGLTAIGFAAMSALLVAGCSSDGNPATGDDDFNLDQPISLLDTLTVTSAANLPVCDASREGRAFFVQNENMPHLCIKGTWRSAADSTDFSITCSDGFLHAVDKIAHQPHLNVDTVRYSGLQRDTIPGVVQNGPFIFGTSVVLNEASEMNFFRADGNGHSASTCVQTNDGHYTLESVSTNSNYVKISATGFYRNMVTGGSSASPVTLSALTKVASSVEGAGTTPIRVRNSVNVNILTQLEIQRIEQLAMNHIEFNEAKAQAEREIFAAFGIDTVQFYLQPYFTDGRTDKPVAEDLDMFGNSEYSAALFAISVMLQGDRSETEMMSLANNLAEDIKGDGVWNDPNWKIKIADWVVGLDTLWKYNDIRNNVSSWGVSAIPNFEKYIRAFIPVAYGFEPCSDANAGQVTYVNQGQSALFANDYEHADHSRVRFICDANSKEWRIAQPIEKDTAGFGPGAYDKEVREGRVNHDTYYIFDSGTWRIATPQEADGFTDIAEVYASLKPNEKAVFIIRHSERTDDTGPTGHLTSNGKTYARNLGKRLAAIANEDFYYGYSGYTRTQETCEEIALGKGQQQYTLDILPYMDGSWYVKDGAKANDYTNADGGWVVYSKYAFTGAYEDAFYDLKTRSEELLKDNILGNISTMKRVNFMCTHDYLVVPLLAYTTSGHANVRYYEKWRWVNYLSGVAMIISPDGSIRYVPVKGLESGTM